ncbi:MAG: DUF1700 domain-containing protein [Eubacteriales bacterium]
MNKPEFLSLLRDKLSGLPKEDIERSLDYYSEIIDDRMEDGLTEEEAVEAVGSAEEVASTILRETSLPKLVRAKVKPNRDLKIWEIILLILGFPLWFPLLAAALIVILAVYIVIWSVIIALYSVDVSFAVGAVSGIFAFFALTFTGNISSGTLFLGAGLFCAGITILMFFGFNQITKWVLILSKKILQGIKACIAGKEGAHENC